MRSRRACTASTHTHTHVADSDVDHELGKSFQVSVQVGCLLLVDSNSEEPALGNTQPHHAPRQGIWWGSAARIWDLYLPHRRSEGVLVFYSKVSG